LRGWPQEVAALPAEHQVQAVAAKRKEWNAGFEGKGEYRIEDGVFIWASDEPPQTCHDRSLVEPSE
jgi:hypothetical protein